MVVCPCVFCKGLEEVSQRTCSSHLEKYGDASKVLLSDFLYNHATSDELFHRVLRLLLGNAFNDKPIFEVKGTSGRALSITTVITPHKEIKFPEDSIKRKHTGSIKDIVQYQAKASCSISGCNKELDMISKRIRTAEVKTFTADEREYVKKACKVECKQQISATDLAIFKAKSNLGTSNVRTNLRPLFRKFNISAESEKDIKLVEDFYTVKYDSAIVSLSHKAVSQDTNVTKSGDVVAKKTPITFCDSQELLTKTLITLKNSGSLLKKDSIKVKLFLDSDATSTKVAMNTLNQLNCNSSYAHPMLVYTEAPEHRRNLEVVFKLVNKEIAALRSFHWDGMSVKLLLCADTKAQWLVLGMGSNGTYPCTFCEISSTEMLKPKSERGYSSSRTYANILHNFNENMRKTQCNPKTQAQFKNVASRPLVDCLVEDENEPLINWLTVPFLHIQSKIGTQLWKGYTEICQDLDFITACNIAYGYLPNTYSSVTDFGALILKIENGEQISATEKCNSGPLSSAYGKFLQGIHCTPQAFHGVSLNGKCSGYFLKAEHHKFWDQHFYNNREIQSVDKAKFQEKLLTLDRLRTNFRDILHIAGTNAEVKNNNEINRLSSSIVAFLMDYRQFYKTISVKIHMLEDHLDEQIRLFGLFSGAWNEQGGECTHALFNNQRHVTDHIRNDEEQIRMKCELATRKYLLRLKENSSNQS